MKSRRGVALILALFATAILVTLSLAFIALAVGEARTSKTAGYEGASIEASNFGIEYALNYMGGGNTSILTPSGPPFSTWESAPWPDGIGFYNTLTRNQTPRLHQGYPVIVESTADDPSLVRYETNVTLQSSIRRIRIVQKQGTGPAQTAVIPLDNGNLYFTFDVVCVPVLGKTRVTSYRLVSTARIFVGQQTGTVVTGTKPAATRVIEVQVLPENPASYLHFLANGRSFNGQGLGEGNLQNVTVNNVTTDIADYAMIPGNYTEAGPLRIDGQDPLKAALSPGLNSWVKRSGNLRFQDGAKGKALGGNVTFRDPVLINNNTNIYNDAALDDTNSGVFSGGFRNSVPHLGLPQVTLADFSNAAKQVPSPNPTSLRAAFFDVPTKNIPGAKGNPNAAPRSNGPGGDPFYDHYDMQPNPTNPSGPPIPIPVPFDYRPRLPNVEINLSKDVVTVVQRDTMTGNVIGGTDSFKVDKLSNGVMYVDGGNAVVNSSTPFEGQLSIVAGDSAGRKYVDTSTPMSAESIYAQAASELFAHERARWDFDRQQGHTQPPATYLTPPYTVTQLKASGVLTAAARAQINNLANDQPLWPAPPPAVDREGNIVVADDVKYGEGSRGTTLGLFAQKFILLNDNTPDNNNKTLSIDAVLMSFERSVQLDFDNTGRQNASVWKQLMQPGYNGTIKLRGSIIGEYVDIEGDTFGRGYNVQDFTHDVNLRNQRPPLCPTWNFAILPGGYRFAITHFNDRGAFSTDNALQ